MQPADEYSISPINPAGFNPKALIPYGCGVVDIQHAMEEFQSFLSFINLQLHTKNLERLEAFIMPANFSSIVGEFMGTTIPKYCSGVVRNQYPNGHPDLVPVGIYPNNAILHGEHGIEIKASRSLKGWQGHNPEKSWLMVFIFDNNTSADAIKGIAPKPFKFVEVLGAQLELEDWTFSGRSETSRRTITASVNNSGYEKMAANWIYRDTNLRS